MKFPHVFSNFKVVIWWSDLFCKKKRKTSLFPPGKPTVILIIEIHVFFKENFDKNPWQPRRNTNIKKYYFFNTTTASYLWSIWSKNFKKTLFEKKCAKKVILLGCIDFNIEKVVIFGVPGKSGKFQISVILCHSSGGNENRSNSLEAYRINVANKPLSGGACSDLAI